VGFPTTQVYIAFNDGPYVASPTWTEVTTYVRQINTQRGRQDEQSNFESGNATVVLDNRSRIFDPFYTSGTYYGKLLPRRQIKIEATISSVTYPVFRGFVEGWPVSITDAGYDTTVTVQCFDALGLLADEEMPDDISSTYILSLSPRHYWPLDDPVDPEDFATDELRDLGSSPQPLLPLATFRTANGPGQAPALPNTSLQVSEATTSLGWGYVGQIQAATDFSVVGWYSTNPQDSTSFFVSAVAGTTLDFGYFTATSTFRVTTIGKTAYTYYNATLAIDTSVPHHFAVNVNSNGTIDSAYIDGQALTLVVDTSGLFNYSVPEAYYTRSGQRQQSAVWFRKLTATEIKTIYRLGRGLLTEGTVDRFNRVIGYTPFPASLTSTPSTSYSATLAEISTGGPPVTDELQTISDSEGGNLFVSRNGTLTLTSRSAIFQGTSFTSQATFGGAGISIGTELTYRLDAKNLRNTLAVGYSGDGSVEVSNPTSITAYGTAGGSWSTQLSSAQDAETLGNLLVGYSATPAVVIDPLQVNVSASDASWSLILGLELLNRITLNIVQQVGSTITQSQILQSIEHTITPDRWITTINGSVRFTNVFTIGTSLIGGPDLIG
jgi:hypothetical protein